MVIFGDRTPRRSFLSLFSQCLSRVCFGPGVLRLKLAVVVKKMSLFSAFLGPKGF